MSDRTRVLAVTACMLCIATGCGRERSSADRHEEAAEQWSLTGEPLLRIGVVSGDERYQMHDVRDAARLADGRIAVAHQGARQVRVYAPDGRFLIASGRDGDGPGEWRMISEVRPLEGDTLLVVDHRLGRYGFVDGLSGSYLGEAGPARTDQLAPDAWHHRGLVLEAPPGAAGPGVFGPVVEQLDLRHASAPTHVRLDREGRIWVSGAPSAEERTIRVFDLDGRLRATLPLPERFRPTDVGAEHVLGVWRDSLDVEYVQLHGIEGRTDWSGPSLAEASASAAPARPAAARVEAADLPELSAAFRSVAVAQEMHYASQATYTTDRTALAEARPLEIPDGARLDLLEASPGGWWGRIVDRASGAGCTLAYGAFAPVAGIELGAFTCWAGAGALPPEG